jgi:hypothetical protein
MATSVASQGAVVAGPVQPAALMLPLPRYTPPAMPGLYRWGLGYDGAMQYRADDVDGDGDLDVFVSPLKNVGSRLWLNDGSGRFLEATAQRMPPSRAYTCFEFQIVDLDGDGDKDMFGTTWENPSRQPILIFINDGSGHYTDESIQRFRYNLNLQSPFYFPFIDMESNAVGDFDRDGDVDLIVSGGTVSPADRESCRMLRNDGVGRFTYDRSAFPIDACARRNRIGDMRVADFDRDGDLDLIHPGYFPGIGYWRNDGRGRFSDASVTHIDSSIRPYSFAALDTGDVDGDGDLDFAASYGGASRDPYLFLNDGTGRFTEVSATHMPGDSIAGNTLHFIDLDEDGDLDLLSIVRPWPYTSYAGQHDFLFNDGTGHFTLDRERRFFGTRDNGGVRQALLEDFDGDGDLDMLEGNNQSMPRPTRRLPYYVNTLRHTHALEEPTRGATWRVLVHGDPGSTAVLALSPQSGTWNLPGIGRLGLDPASIVVWNQSQTIPASRQVAFYLPIPNLPQILGAPLYVQSILRDPSGRLRLTNMWGEPGIR